MTVWKEAQVFKKRDASVWYMVDPTLKIPLYLYYSYFKIFIYSDRAVLFYLLSYT